MRYSRHPLLPAAALALAATLGPITASAAAIIPGALANMLPTGDDVFSSAVAHGLGGPGGLRLFGSTSTTLYVNNNGILTFDSPYPTVVPNGLATGFGIPFLAPFYADIDTRGIGTVSYGSLTIDGRPAFAANWINVGYYRQGTDRNNSFQTVLVDRSDTGAGNFDFQFNYDRIQWESGALQGGRGGLGGLSAVVGWANGLEAGNGGVFYELPGSLENGALLDGGSNALVSNSLGLSGVQGRYEFQVRNGQVSEPATVPEPISATLVGVGLLGTAVVRRLRRDRTDR